jgi:DNA-binding IclR family transcriptional regulator
VTELAEALDINKSTAFRILDTFLEANMVEKNKETLKYKLGPAILRLSEQYYKNYNIIADAKPLMERLAAEIRESVPLCVCANTAPIHRADHVGFALVVNAKIGNSEPSLLLRRKCLLAFADPEDRDRYIAKTFDIYTDNTISGRRTVRRNGEVRAAGYAVDDGEIANTSNARLYGFRQYRENACIHWARPGGPSRMTPEKIDSIIPL